jgi:chromosome segregation ATPase
MRPERSVSRRGRFEVGSRGLLEARPRGNHGREVFLPVESVTVALARPAVEPPGELARVREELDGVLEELEQTREILAEARVTAATAKGEAGALRQALDDARAERDRERQRADGLAAALDEARRPLWQRVLAELRRPRG